MDWSAPPENIRLDEGRLDVWAADLDALANTEGLDRLLDDGERIRAVRFLFEEDRRRFRASHAALRVLLARYTGEEPHKIRFSRNSWGKPFLAAPADSAISFSMSHSGELALYALAQGWRVGIDVEKVEPNFPGFDIASRFFSPREVEGLRGMEDELKALAFFTCWVRKEAFIKAVGKGLHIPLDSFDVPVDPGAAPALLATRFNAEETGRWAYVDVPRIDGYAAALAAEGAAVETASFRLPTGWFS